MRRFTLVPLLLLGLSACAAQQSEPAPAQGYPGSYGAPPAEAQPTAGPGYAQPPSNNALTTKDAEFSNLADAEREFERSRVDIELTLMGVKGGKPSDQNEKKPEEAEPLARGNSSCERVCKALASMRRAADAVCRLAGETDSRCARARSLVKENEARVSACACEPPKE